MTHQVIKCRTPLAGRAALLALVASIPWFGATPADAVQYPLQFGPPGNYKDLHVAGYQIIGKTVIGNCSYTQIFSGSGRDPHTTYTPIPQTCTWSLYGALLSVSPGAPVVPSPVGVVGSQTIYAQRSSQLYTGTDSTLSHGGFVFKYGAHYDWVTSNGYMVLAQVPYNFTASLASNGDIPLSVSVLRASSKLRGVKVTINSTTCIPIVAPASNCDVNITYDDTKLTSGSGLAYDTLTIHLVSNAGVGSDFVQSYTDQVKIPPD